MDDSQLLSSSAGEAHFTPQITGVREPSLLAPPAESLGEHCPPVLVVVEAQQALLCHHTFVFFIASCALVLFEFWLREAGGKSHEVILHLSQLHVKQQGASLSIGYHCCIALQSLKMPAVHMYYNISCNPTLIPVWKNTSIKL